ncbi:ribonuclease H family protein [Psittacicella gerlachiana]|uniref:ribonuclease H n=1 Tax=Psittacicella gerlachiana TaxID=2028574 RepID=A0A3A1YC73_9GAMM|nr:ribonuclease H [Psittacicella gerlachiana]RIY34770.1 hypothetical protein CKF59_04840 [Psittacicella gerlachiana]
MLTVYIDGACRKNPGKGGYAFAVFDQEQKLILHKSKGFILTTNNRMEISAFLYAMFYLHQEKLIKRGDKILFKTDSNYLKDSMTKWIEGWVKQNWKDKKNPDLFKRCYLYKKHFAIKWEKVAAHTGIAGNELVDTLATQAADLETSLLYHDEIYEAENPSATKKLKKVTPNYQERAKLSKLIYPQTQVELSELEIGKAKSKTDKSKTTAKSTSKKKAEALLSKKETTESEPASANIKSSSKSGNKTTTKTRNKTTESKETTLEETINTATSVTTTNTKPEPAFTDPELQRLHQHLTSLFSELEQGFKENCIPREYRETQGLTHTRLQEINQELFDIFVAQYHHVKKKEE